MPGGGVCPQTAGGMAGVHNLSPRTPSQYRLRMPARPSLPLGTTWGAASYTGPVRVEASSYFFVRPLKRLSDVRTSTTPLVGTCRVKTDIPRKKGRQ